MPEPEICPSWKWISWSHSWHLPTFWYFLWPKRLRTSAWNKIPFLGEISKENDWLFSERNATFHQMTYMDVSLNGGIHKSSILIGCSIINHPFWGTTILGNPHINDDPFATKKSPNLGPTGVRWIRPKTVLSCRPSFELLHLCHDQQTVLDSPRKHTLFGAKTTGYMEFGGVFTKRQRMEYHLPC